LDAQWREDLPGSEWCPIARNETREMVSNPINQIGPHVNLAIDTETETHFFYRELIEAIRTDHHLRHARAITPRQVPALVHPLELTVTRDGKTGVWMNK
jgi:hypothetical protein